MSTGKVKWGVLGVASIARRKVIPGMQQGEYSEIAAIASRDLARAEEAAAKFGIAKAYGSYEALLADPEIEAVYNPLPNHLHLPWSVRAMEAGKHVLCEKPIGLNAAEARELLAARDRTGRKCGEAFMVRSHPQWLRARELVRSGKIGDLRAIMASFSYFDRETSSIHNDFAGGGGALLDIGCYPIHNSRFIFGEEPTRVIGLVERDPEMKVDRLTSAILDYPSGQAIFTASTQLVYHQSMEIFCTHGRIVFEIPYSAPLDKPTNIVIDEGRAGAGNSSTVETIAACNQYTMQGDAFSRAIREDGEVPVPVEDAIKNMAVIDAVFRSGTTGQWEKPGA
ncbi:MAG: Gfo/Idh/MocA family oxidoreductase [Candidatus Acidiferrum sp.]